MSESRCFSFGCNDHGGVLCPFIIKSWSRSACLTRSALKKSALKIYHKEAVKTLEKERKGFLPVNLLVKWKEVQLPSNAAIQVSTLEDNKLATALKEEHQFSLEDCSRLGIQPFNSFVQVDQKCFAVAGFQIVIQDEALASIIRQVARVMLNVGRVSQAQCIQDYLLQQKKGGVAKAKAQRTKDTLQPLAVRKLMSDVQNYVHDALGLQWVEVWKTGSQERPDIEQKGFHITTESYSTCITVAVKPQKKHSPLDCITSDNGPHFENCLAILFNCLLLAQSQTEGTSEDATEYKLIMSDALEIIGQLFFHCPLRAKAYAPADYTFLHVPGDDRWEKITKMKTFDQFYLESLRIKLEACEFDQAHPKVGDQARTCSCPFVALLDT